MKHTRLFFLFAALLITSASCHKIKADGPLISETRYHSGFNAISCDIDATVIFTQSDDYHVEICAQQALLDKMRTEVEGGELHIYYPGGIYIGRHEPVTIYISAPAVSGFNLNGSGELRGGVLRAGNKTVRLKISGSGKMDFSNLSAGALEASVVGSGKMNAAAGTVVRESCEISGSGDIDFNNLDAEDVTTRISGSGTIRTAASNTLDVRISGSGKVYYRGTPRVTTSISGSGKVQPY